MSREANSGRVVPLPREVEVLEALPDPSYTYAYELNLGRPVTETAEQWAGAVFGEAPTPLWWFMVFGWHAGLGLRLARSTDPTCIKGWTVVSSTPATTILGLEGRWLRARLVVLVEGERVIHATLVRYVHPFARVLWTPTDPIHRKVIPYLMQRAARRESA